jgi:2,4-dienoyl-CoA reductase-like NADH-dependent reductase (Old Yellow Enzyme family)/NADPH-dependent 2,4-dienoyl-CoA reductase/sulfur reductase-like enzyme
MRRIHQVNNDKHALLMSPLKVGSTVWRNRIQTGPMSMTELGYGEVLSRDNIAFYERLAEGGAAVVTIGESIIPSQNGKTHAQQIMLGNPDVLASLARVADAIHAKGALADIEISHGGIMADPIYNGGNNLIGPVGLFDDYAGEVYGMDEAMMEEIAEAFADATYTVKRCGFDMAMIHAGHGWLLSQFLSPLYNTRTDQYGGSIENRMKFPLMVLKRVREKVGKGFTLDMRVSGSEFLKGGAEIFDCVAFCREAQKYVDVINVSAGAPWTKRMVPSVFEARGINSVFAAEVKANVQIPVTTVGGFAEPDGMERVLQDGIADGIILGRGILADPFLPQKVKGGKSDTIHKCIRCFVCNEGLYSTRNLRCSINPEAGREEAIKCVRTATQHKKVLVAGGGPGGMTAAITAARRGHRVILFEKTGALGGALKTEAVIPFKKDMADFSDTLEAELAESDAEVRLNTALTPDIALREKADVILAAIGASPIVPHIEGIDAKTVMTAEDYLTLSPSGGSHVAVIGGGLVGSELGLYLAMQGKDAVIVEMRDEIAIDATPDYRRFLLAEIESRSVHLKVAVNLTCKRVTAEGIVCVSTSPGASVAEEVFFEADAVVLAAGYAPRRDESEAMRTLAGDFRAIGDCTRVARVYEAVRAGYDAGMNI